MARLFRTSSLRQLLRLRRSRRSAGFTLTELLVSIIIGGIISALLLTLVVQMTDTNQKDASRSETQRDMQAAMDFIVQDLREAVFVYDGVCLQGNGTPTAADFKSKCPGIVNHIPATVATGTSTPILAFWRTDPLPPGLAATCGANFNRLNANPQPAAIQGVPCLSGASYSLVVYAIDTSNTTGLWRGKARLKRFKLSQFTENATTGANRSPGYVYPLPEPDSQFFQWPYIKQSTNGTISIGNGQTALPTDTSQVLVDFVDDGLNNSFPTQPTCIAPATITPLTTNNPIRGFYACVRGSSITDTTEQGLNQEVQLVLTGNIAGRSGFPLASSSQLYPIQTRVLARGIVKKTPR